MQINKLFSSHFTTNPKAGPTGRACRHLWKRRPQAAHFVAMISTSLKAADCVSGCWYPSRFLRNSEHKPLPKARHCQFAAGHTCSSVRAGALAWRSSHALAWASSQDAAIQGGESSFPTYKHVKHSEKYINDGFEYLSLWNNSFYSCGNMETSVTAAMVYKEKWTARSC